MTIHEAFRECTLPEWRDALYQSIRNSSINGVTFPKYTHKSILGSATAQDAIDEGLKFYKLVRESTELRPDMKYLDFGCGTGRIYRCFLKDFPTANMHAADVAEDLIGICKSDFLDPDKFTHIAPHPPLPYADASFDLITAYSVFSHLSQAQAMRWVKEFRRVLKPGGKACLTTWGVRNVETMLSQPVENASDNYKRKVKALQAHGSAVELLKKDDFVYIFGSGKGPYNPNDYGMSYVSEGYIRRVWADHLKLVKYVESGEQLDQCFFVLEK